MPKFLGRDPVLFLNLVAALVAGVSDFIWPLTADQQAIINAAAFAIANVLASFMVHDGQLPAIMAGFKAILAVALGFGLKLSPDQQVVLMTLVGAVGALLVRPQVVAKVPLAIDGQVVAPVAPPAAPVVSAASSSAAVDSVPGYPRSAGA